MLQFCDFVPPTQFVLNKGFFSNDVEKVGSFAEAVARAGEFIKQNGIVAPQIETVVLPNMWDESGTQDPSLVVRETGYQMVSRWYQFVRVWYDNEPPPPSPYR